MEKKMDYKEYCESVRDVAPLLDKELYYDAVMWPNRARLPLRLISIGDGNPSVVKVPESVKNKYGSIVPVVGISGSAFAGNKNVTDIILPSGIGSFPAGAFAGCRNLKNITIPKNIPVILEKTFEECVSLENVFYEGTIEEWRKLKIVHEKHEIEFGNCIPGTPVHQVLSERLVNIPGNDALFSATIHFRCEFEKTEQPSSFQIKMGNKDVTDLFLTV
ncbi:MAG: leucine-rich repeat protein [Lachnospiraceae bacterium]|nr:leucine-rich repeat protein [Lachnospiraceae bacterium]